MFDFKTDRVLELESLSIRQLCTLIEMSDEMSESDKATIGEIADRRFVELKRLELELQSVT